MDQDWKSNALDYYADIERDANHRFRSWEHCYDAFAKLDEAKRDEVSDYLALHLAFYLASWGMYRGSSKLLQKDYQIHIGGVKILKDYRQYRGNPRVPFDVILDIYRDLHDYYGGIPVQPTPTLITKIMLGTLGCIPAFDRFFVKEFYNQNVASFNQENLNKIFEFADKNSVELRELQKKLTLHNAQKTPYPIMKIIDMGFWEKKDVTESMKSDKANQED